MDEELAEPPALQLGALHLERLGQRLGRERAGGHQADAEQRTASRDGDGVDLSVAEPDGRLVALGLGQGEASGRALGGQLEEHAVHTDREAHVRHA